MANRVGRPRMRRPVDPPADRTEVEDLLLDLKVTLTPGLTIEDIFTGAIWGPLFTSQNAATRAAIVKKVKADLDAMIRHWDDPDTDESPPRIARARRVRASDRKRSRSGHTQQGTHNSEAS